MSAYTLKITHNNQTEVVNLSQQTTKITVQPNTQYQLLDAQGNLIAQPQVQVIGNDLAVFVEGQELPELVLENYANNFAVESQAYLSNTQSTFATVDSASSLATANEAVLASEVATTTATTATATATGVSSTIAGISSTAFWTTVGGLAAVGGVAAAAGGGSSSEPEVVPQTQPEETPKSESEETPQTQPEETPKSESEETPQTEPEETPKSESEEAPQTQPEETPKSESEEAPQTEPEETPKSESEETPQTPPEETPKSESEETPQTPPEETPKSESEETPQTEPEETPKSESGEVPQTQPEETPKSESEETPQTEPEETPKSESGEVPQTQPEETPKSESEETSQTQPEETPKSESEEAPQTPPEETPTDTTINKPTLSIDDITDGNTINQAEKATQITVSGTITDLDGDIPAENIKVLVGSEEVVATVTGDRWQATLSGETLAASEGEQQLTVKATVTDTAGNTATETATKSYRVDTVIEKPIITLNPIAGDDIISGNELKQANTTISGKVANVEHSAAKAGDVVKVYVGTTSTLEPIQGELRLENNELVFSVDVPTVSLVAHQAEGLRIEVATADEANNTITGEQTASYKVVSSEKSITLNDIAGDNIINQQESQNDVTVSGVVTNATAGENVDLYICRCPTCTGAIWEKLSAAEIDENGAFKLSVNGQQLGVNGETPAIKAIYTDPTSATVEAKKAYSVDTELNKPVTTLAIAGDNVIDVSEVNNAQTIISGVLTLDSDVNNVAVSVTINGQTHSAKVEGNSWILPVATSTLTGLSDKNVSVTVTATDEAGNQSVSDAVKQSFVVKTTLEKPVIIFDSVTADNFISRAESQGEFILVTGRVTNGIAGQTMQVGHAIPGGKTQFYDVVIQADGTFSHQFNPADLVSGANTGGAPLFQDTYYSGVRRGWLRANYTATDGAGGEAKADQKEHIYFIKTTDPQFDIAITTPLHDGKVWVNKEMYDEGVAISGTLSPKVYQNFKDRYSATGNAGVTKAILTLNGKEYETTDITKTDSGYHFTVKIPNADVESAVEAGNTTLSVAGETVDSLGNTGKVSTNVDYIFDITPPELTIEINKISEDNFINIAESKQVVEFSGALDFDSSDVVSGTVQVELTVNGVTHLAKVDENAKTWRLTLEPSAVATKEGEVSVSAVAYAQDQFGNVAKTVAPATYTVDFTRPQIEIKLDPINDNDKVTSGTESNVTLSGHIKGEFSDSDKVSLKIGDTTHTVSLKNISGEGKERTATFSFETTATALSAENIVPLVSASINATDQAGNALKAQADRPYSISNGKIEIEINGVTADNLINVTEAKDSEGKLTISGKISGDEATSSSVVTLKINGETVSATVKSDLTFTAEIEPSKLLNNNGWTVQATVSNGNATATTSKTYDVSPDAIAQIDIKQIGDFSIETVGLQRITGKVEFDGTYGTGLNASLVRDITLIIGDKRYTAGLDTRTQEFYVDIPETELVALNGANIRYEFGTASTVFKLTQNANGSYAVTNPTREDVSVKSLTLTGAVTANDNGVYSVEAKPSYTVVSGTVSGVAVENDTVKVVVGEQSYLTTVQADKTFTVNVETAVLAKNANQTVKATLQTKNLKGNAIEVSDTERYIAPKAVGSEFVNELPANGIPSGSRNIDHTQDNYNFPYFIDGITQEPIKGFNFNSHIPVGGGGATIKYHFMTKEDIAKYGELTSAPYNSVSKAGTYTEYDDKLKDYVREAYKVIGQYLNVKFEESDSYITQTEGDRGSNHYGAQLIGNLQSNAGFGQSGNVVVWDVYKNFWAWGENFIFYTALHEISHTLTLNHMKNEGASNPGFVGRGYELEDNTEFGLMSYNANYEVFAKRDLRMYDLAALHYRYGVNREARAGDDVYTFKKYNFNSSDGDIYIWDGNGVDTFDASNEKQGVTVNLTPGSWSYRGTELSKYFAVDEKKTYTAKEYFKLADNATVTGTASMTLTHYKDDQVFIGYDTQIENLKGSAYKDVLIGNNADNNIQGGAGDDLIKGGAGNDYLDGGAGDDEMHGGTGDDIYVVDSLNDKVIELENEGTDTVYSSVNFTLGDHIEHLTLIGTTATEGIGNALDNTLIANNIGNTLNGGAGNDRLIGGLGEDTLTGGDGQDTFVFNTALNGKVDTITDFNVSDDKIELASAVFSGLTATNVRDLIKYDSATGKLTYDQDGSGIIDPIHFATLNTGLDAAQIRYEVV